MKTQNNLIQIGSYLLGANYKRFFGRFLGTFSKFFDFFRNLLFGKKTHQMCPNNGGPATLTVLE
jgi:hypothetical protein